MIRIAITGRPGVGKSTVIAKVLEELDANVSGIQCVKFAVVGSVWVSGFRT